MEQFFKELSQKIIEKIVDIIKKPIKPNSLNISK